MVSKLEVLKLAFLTMCPSSDRTDTCLHVMDIGLRKKDLPVVVVVVVVIVAVVAVVTVVAAGGVVAAAVVVSLSDADTAPPARNCGESGRSLK